jgi:putative colanic acid biosynthesis UDP-glucose lipid carrier transferase
MYFESVSLSATSLAQHSLSSLKEAQGRVICSNQALIERALLIGSSRSKRVFDVVLSALLIVCLSPLMLIIALAIKFEGVGPVLFRQQRYGLDRTIFSMMKFRSMTVLEETGSFQQVGLRDARITKVGFCLRRTSLDELPQLFNVLLGQMSLVGPRPHAVPMDDAFALVIPHYRDRHRVKPGITGLAQIAGLRGPTVVADTMRQRIWRDRAYIRRWTFATDLKILLLTPLRILGPNAF